MPEFAVQPKSFGEFDDDAAEYCASYDDAQDVAFDWSIDEGGAPMIIWKLTSNNPIRWSEVIA
jgi:hypothetical protein